MLLGGRLSQVRLAINALFGNIIWLIGGGGGKGCHLGGFCIFPFN